MSPSPSLGHQQSQQQSLQQMPRVASRLLALNKQDLGQELRNLAQHNPFLEVCDEGASAQHFTKEQPTLKQHLHSQLAVMPLDERARDDCERCLDSLDERGFLPAMPELARAAQIAKPRTAKALAVIRTLNPVGAGAHDLADCLLMQIDATADRPGKIQARKLILHNFDKLSRGRIDKLPKGGLMPALEVIRSLSPAFASDFASPAAYQTPDLEAFSDSGVWRVRFYDHEELVSIHKYTMKPPPGRDGSEWRKLAREARTILSAVNFRGSTMLAVAQALVDRQRRFFTSGKGALVPVGLRDLAQETGFSISTISATLRHKSLAYPGGVITLKYLLQRKTGGNISAAALQEAIRKIVEAENPDHPLSDESIMMNLQAEHGKPHRRTIAKHRQLARIPPAHIRRQRHS